MSTVDWRRSFEHSLNDLGVGPDQARRLAEETLGHAADAGVEPAALFGPAHSYALRLSEELHPAHPTNPTHPSHRATGSGRDGRQTTAARRFAGERLTDHPLADPRPVLVLKGAGKRYRRKWAVSGLDLTVRPGEVAAIVGANGSGKSTTLRICAGLVRPSAGLVQRRGLIGYVPQHSGLLPLLSPDEHFTLAGAGGGLPARLARSTGRHLAGALCWNPTAERTSTLSGGTQQKLSLVLGSLNDPDLLLLDEPYQGFDQGTYVNFWHQVWRWRDTGKAVVLVTHLLHELDNVDHVLELPPPAGEYSNGRSVDSPAEDQR